ncbi:MAG: tRNA pseudouridine(38-40) synthase TruA [Tissierellia bacterium]|nr:tRNA pseudouridine(38-40) synthase TruA [Tissierellia bacterium]
MMRRFVLKLQYDGRGYRGWQRQKNTKNTIQGHLNSLIERAFDQPIDLQGASRTDAGVHAAGQVAGFDLDTDLAPVDIARRINRYLPEDIAVTGWAEVDRSFHVRHAVVNKKYCYTVYESDKLDVFQRHLEWTVEGPLDIEVMKRAASPLIGKHDFSGFSVGRSKKSIRTIEQLEIAVVSEDNGRRIRFSVTGDGFLHHMIRLIVGTLIAIGRGQLPVGVIETILQDKNRSLAILAPAGGLCLMEVHYPTKIF